MINLNNNDYYESHQRTPGQILSLTSNIEFSPFFNSSVCEFASPEFGRRLADNNRLKLLNCNNNNNNASKINFQKIIHQHNQHQNLSRQIFHHNSNEKVCVFPPASLLKNNDDSEKFSSSIIDMGNKANATENDLSISKVDFEISKVGLNSSGKNCSLLMSPDLKEVTDQHLMDDGSFLGAHLSHINSNSERMGNASAKKEHSQSSSFDVYQRRQTPLRWSKQLTKQKKKFNLSLSNNKSLILRPKFKGNRMI